MLTRAGSELAQLLPHDIPGTISKIVDFLKPRLIQATLHEVVGNGTRYEGSPLEVLYKADDGAADAKPDTSHRTVSSEGRTT